MIAGLIVSVALVYVGGTPSAERDGRQHRDALAKYGGDTAPSPRAPAQRRKTTRGRREGRPRHHRTPKRTRPALHATRPRAGSHSRRAQVLKKDPGDYDTAAMLARSSSTRAKRKKPSPPRSSRSKAKRCRTSPRRPFTFAADSRLNAKKAGDLAAAETALRKASSWSPTSVRTSSRRKPSRRRRPITAAAECFTHLGNVLVKRAKFDFLNRSVHQCYQT